MSVGNHGLHFKVNDFIVLVHYQTYSTAEKNLAILAFLYYGEFLKWIQTANLLQKYEINFQCSRISFFLANNVR